MAATSENGGQAAETTDRRVHGMTQAGTAIVRYERAGKWYLEGADHRLPITLGDAVLFACADGAVAYLGKPGGTQFDAGVRKERERGR